ncbi:MAG: phosphatase PAP2 family protein [Candidatus Micrarchaeota archaeon]
MFEFVSNLAYSGSLILHDNLFYIALTIAIAIFVSYADAQNTKKKFYHIVSTIAVCLLLAILLKELIATPRPCMLEGGLVSQCPNNFSLPSTHAAVAFALAVALIGGRMFPLALLWGVVVSASRIYLGVHTPIDVFAGLGLAIFALAIVESFEVHQPVLAHKRKWKGLKKSVEYARQFVHAGIGILFFAIAYFFGNAVGAVLVAFPLLFGIIIFHFKSIGIKVPVADDILKFVERPGFAPGFGALAFFAGMLICLAFFEQKMALSMLFILTISDSVSTIIGRKYGKIPLPYNKKKSYAGSAAFFVSSLPVYFIGGIPALGAAVVATVLESLPIKLDDNLTIPWAGLVAI